MRRINTAVSISDVAARAGVSRGTVSHVLNGNTHARIAKATQERVLCAVQELGYRPNKVARSLGRRRSDTLALILTGLRNPFYALLQGTFEDMALGRGYHIFVDTMRSNETAETAEPKLSGWPVDGAIVWTNPAFVLSEYFGKRAESIPVVYLSGQPGADGCDSVYFDVYGGAQAAMAHLIDRGHTRIACVYPFEWAEQQPDEPRLRAYREACDAAGLSQQLILMRNHSETRRAGAEAAFDLLDLPKRNRPTAAYCWNDVIAEGVMFGARRKGLRVPADLAIVGFDGIEDARFLDLPLTTVQLPFEPMCSQALRLLMDRIDGHADLAAREIVIPTELVVGETT